MRYWPWFTTVPAVLAALSPLGRDMLHAAFISGEQLSRNIWGPIVMIALAVLFVLAVTEWIVRLRFYRGRTAAQTTSIRPGTES